MRSLIADQPPLGPEQVFFILAELDMAADEMVATLRRLTDEGYIEGDAMPDPLPTEYPMAVWPGDDDRDPADEDEATP